MRKLILVTGTLAGLLATIPVQAKPSHDVPEPDCSRNLRSAYSNSYYAVRHKLGSRAPGRNVRRDGVKFRTAQKTTAVRRAKCSELERSLAQLRALTRPVRVRSAAGRLVRRAGQPAQAPTGVLSPRVAAPGGGSSNSMVNPSCESGGNPQVYSPSGQYWGKYQFDRGTWAAHGGSPGSYGSAPEGEQDRVAAQVTYDAWPNC